MSPESYAEQGIRHPEAQDLSPKLSIGASPVELPWGRPTAMTPVSSTRAMNTASGSLTISRRLVIEEGQSQFRHGNDAGPNSGLRYGRELW